MTPAPPFPTVSPTAPIPPIARDFHSFRHYSALRARPTPWQQSDKFRTNYALATKMMTTTMARMGNGMGWPSDGRTRWRYGFRFGFWIWFRSWGRQQKATKLLLH